MNKPVALSQGEILHILQNANSVPVGQPIWNSTEEYNKLKAIIECAVSYTHPANACKHGVDDGACKECYLESSNPYKAITDTKIETTVVSYTHPVKEPTYEDGIEECAQRAEAYAYMSPNFTALAEELRAILRKAQEK